MADLVIERPVSDCVGFLRSSSRSDLIAALAGTAMLPFALFVCYPLEGEIRPSLSGFLLLLSLSFGASFFSASRACTSVIPVRSLLPSGARLGARVGTLVYLTGGGMFLLAGVLRIGWRGVPSGDFSWIADRTQAIAAIVLIALPTVAAGILGAVGRFSLNLRSPRSASSPSRIRTLFPALGAPVYSAVSAFILCLLSPTVLAIMASRQPAQDPPEREDPASPPPVPRDPVRPAPPAPDNLAAVPASRWRITSSRPIPGLAAGQPASFSPDGRFLAHASGDGGTLAVLDLQSDLAVRSVGHLPKVSRLAWSPKDDRILCVCESAPAPFLLIGSATGEVVRLPLRAKVPSGTPKWTREGAVEFYEGSRRTGMLDLGSSDLAAYPRASAVPPTWTGPLAETDRCRLRIAPRIVSLGPPDGSERLGYAFEFALVADDKRVGQTWPLLDQPVGTGTQFLSTPDASKLVVLTKEGATIHRIGLRQDSPPSRFEAELPDTSDPTLRRLVRHRRLAAFILAPRAEARGGHAVGGDPDRVRALVFISGTSGSLGTFDVAESYAPILPGDVIGHFHHWEGGSPFRLSGSGVGEWWSRITPAEDEAAAGSFVQRRLGHPEFADSAAGWELVGWGRAHPPARPSSSPPQAVLPRSAGDVAGGRPQEDSVARFVLAHHAKVAAHDPEGFAGDYAETVELNGKGPVTRESIRRDQAAYLPRYDQLSETVVGPVAVEATATGWRASYTIRSYAIVRRDRSVSDRRVRLTLDLRATEAGGLEIVRERAEASN